MSKCISKKILIFLFVTVASLCTLIPCLTFQVAQADRVEYVVSEQTVDGTTDIESRIAELTEGIEYYKQILDPIVKIDSEGTDSALSQMLNNTRDRFNYNDFAFVQGSLYGNYGLNGLLGIYEVAYKFYEE